ncbi:MAG: hypothetical protein L5656_08640 [Thermanaeromonas sp.]|uniref:hypothetical protein n=1 Tax=Thermanaeromonas sp. TaxID=2003697 RepID=UPI0024401FD1|nr:hypothetical protein [Thermanaeromonas sp.]MCG0278579.1 hypothetical protein [Thermanaeromonas sp.]
MHEALPGEDIAYSRYNILDTYLGLSLEEEKEVEEMLYRELSVEEVKKVMELRTSWH